MDAAGWASDCKYKYYHLQTTTSFCNTTQQRVVASGYESSRRQSVTHADGTIQEWLERVLLIHSPSYEQQQQRGLDQRLQTATTKLQALTPSTGRGKRQIQELEVLQRKAQAILNSHRVEGLTRCAVAEAASLSCINSGLQLFRMPKVSYAVVLRAAAVGHEGSHVNAGQMAAKCP